MEKKFDVNAIITESIKNVVDGEGEVDTLEESAWSNMKNKFSASGDGDKAGKLAKKLGAGNDTAGTVNSAVSKTSETVRNAASATGNAIEKGVKKAGEAAGDAGDAIKAGAKKASEVAGDAASSAGKAVGDHPGVAAAGVAAGLGAVGLAKLMRRKRAAASKK